MKIGVISSVADTLDSFFLPLVAQWEREGHQVCLAAGTKATWFENEVLTGLTRRPSPRNCAAHNQLSTWARSNDLDVIVSSTATASALARMPKLAVPVVYFCHGLHWNTGESIIDRVWMHIESALLRNTAAVMCMNSDDRAWFRSRFPENRTLFLENGVGVPLDEYQVKALPDAGSLRLLWAGEFSPRKRPFLMLSVARHLAEMEVDFQLKLIGKGALLEKAKAHAIDLGIWDYCEFPGFASFAENMNDSHMLVHTSEWEGLPRVMLEARAMRRHSIAFDVKGVRDVPGAILVPDNDPIAFAKTIVETWSSLRNNSHLLPPPPPELDSAAVASNTLKFLLPLLRSDEESGAS